MAHQHHTAPPPPPRNYQEVLNESWPLVDNKGQPHARGIKDKGRIPVRVRLILARDGEIWLDGRAVRWHGQCVCVAVWDDRLASTYVWVDAGDVKRR